MTRARPPRLLQSLVRGAALAGVLAVAGFASGAAAAPPFWRVMGPHTEVDLFGSLHLLAEGAPWETPKLLSALSKADEVWFEIPLDATAQADTVKLVREKAVLPPTASLASLIGPALDARVRALALKEGVDAAVLERVKPWFAELELTIAFYQRQGYREDLGVEAEINKAAPSAAVRGAFETPAEQIALFADDPMPEQVASLKETLDDIDTDPDTFARAAAAWRRGDVKGIEREVVVPMRKEDAELYDRLIVARNRRFAVRIEQLLQGDKRIFVVVGAGHLVGPDGVPALLRRDGLKVQGP